MYASGSYVVNLQFFMWVSCSSNSVDSNWVDDTCKQFRRVEHVLKTYIIKHVL